MVVAGGKGGVGKSVMAAAIAGATSRRDSRTLLVDGNMDLGDLHVLLNVEPTARLESLWRGEVTARELLHPIRHNLWFLPGDSGAHTLYGLGSADRARLFQRTTEIFKSFDAVIIDAGVDLTNVVRVCTLAGERLLVVTAPEPSALTDAYAVIKIVTLQVHDLPIGVLVNRARSESEAQAAYERLATASRRLLSRPLRYVGAVMEDDVFNRAVRGARHVLDAAAESPVGDVVERLIAGPAVGTQPAQTLINEMPVRS